MEEPKKISQEDIDAMLGKHTLWLRTNEREGERACLSGFDLSGSDLSGADLSEADLNSADLSYADLSYADLRGADLSYTKLHRTTIKHADFRDVDLDFSTGFSLCCEGTKAKVSIGLIYQYLAHLLSFSCPDDESLKREIDEKIRDYAARSPRYKDICPEECGESR
jgi:hypothetical protein